MPARLRRIGGLAARGVIGALVVGTCMASDCFGDDDTTTTTTTTDGGDLSGAQLEVTVDGTHVGPYVLGASAASFVDVNDQFGQLAKSTISLQLSASGDQVTEAFTVQVSRFGSNLVPFGAAAYTIAEPTSGATSDRTASLSGGATVTAGSLTLQCGGNGCGALFVINALDASHIEGYFTATMADPSDGQQSSVVVTFYAPWTTYSP